MPFSVRLATPADLEQICGLLEHGFFPAAQKILIADIRKRFDDGTCISFVASADDTIVGHATIKQDSPDKAYFGSLVVHEAYRHNGIANALSQARVAHLQINNFQGSAQSDAVTLHPYSQLQLYAVGFHAVRILLGGAPDHGAGPETTVGFSRFFSPSGLWKPEVTTLSLYMPSEHREIAVETLRPFGTVAFQETAVDILGDKIRSIAASEDIRKPGMIYAVRLYEPAAPAEIAFLRNKGYIVAGFYPVIKDGKISAVAHMYLASDVALHKEKINVIPSAQKLFEFVWEQYAQLRNK